MTKPVLVGIAGGSGSGKSWLARQIVATCGESHSTLIEQDWYYRDLSHLPQELAAKTDFDDPAALELELLETHLRELLEGQPIDAPQYDFSNFSRKPRPVSIQPKPLIVVEGLFVIRHAGIVRLLDRSVFVDTASDVRLIRRIKRDLNERGYQLDRVLDFWERNQIPSFAKFVEPQREQADHCWDSLQDTAFVPAFLSDLQIQIVRNADQPTP